MNVPHVAISDDVVALLKHCQTLQSEKEGVIRPAPEAYNRDDVTASARRLATRVSCSTCCRWRSS